jgi:hypothetical protein
MVAVSPGGPTGRVSPACLRNPAKGPAPSFRLLAAWNLKRLWVAPSRHIEDVAAVSGTARYGTAQSRGLSPGRSHGFAV